MPSPMNTAIAMKTCAPLSLRSPPSACGCRVTGCDAKLPSSKIFYPNIFSAIRLMLWHALSGNKNGRVLERMQQNDEEGAARYWRG